MSSMPFRRAIIGVGNVLCGDEGVGVHAARRLETADVPLDVAIWDGGTEGLVLMDAVVGLERLVIVDCVRGGEPPGTIYCFSWEDLPSQARRGRMSAHQTSFEDVLEHVALIAPLPRTTVVGVEPARLELGIGLSPQVKARMEQICALCWQQVME